jgi:hypothetical protein
MILLMKYHYFFSLFLLPLLILSCERKDVEPKFSWDELLGDYSGEFDCDLHSKNTDYWFTVDRNASLTRVSADTIKILFKDTTYTDVPVYYTQRKPYLDTIYYWDLNLEPLVLHSVEVDYVGAVEAGTLAGAVRVIEEGYDIASGMVGLSYLNNEENKHSIHMNIERYLPLGSNAPDTTEATFFRGFR